MKVACIFASKPSSVGISARFVSTLVQDRFCQCALGQASLPAGSALAWREYLLELEWWISPASLTVRVSFSLFCFVRCLSFVAEGNSLSQMLGNSLGFHLVCSWRMFSDGPSLSSRVDDRVLRFLRRPEIPSWHAAKCDLATIFQSRHFVAITSKVSGLPRLLLSTSVPCCLEGPTPGNALCWTCVAALAVLSGHVTFELLHPVHHADVVHVSRTTAERRQDGSVRIQT